ncbi:trypsin domain protein, partial [Vibrio parahaemolyticus VPTS-2010]
RVKLE